MKVFNEWRIVNDFGALLFLDLEPALRTIESHVGAPSVEEMFIYYEKCILAVQMVLDVNFYIRVVIKDRENSLFLILFIESPQAQHSYQGVFCNLILCEIDRDIPKILHEKISCQVLWRSGIEITNAQAENLSEVSHLLPIMGFRKYFSYFLRKSV